MIRHLVAGFTGETPPSTPIHQVSLVMCRESVMDELGEVNSFGKRLFECLSVGLPVDSVEDTLVPVVLGSDDISCAPRY